MTLPVSTSGSLEMQVLGVAVPVGVVGDLVDPAAPDDADPRPGQDPHGVGVVVAAGTGFGVDLRGPGAGVAAVVGERGDGDAEAFVAGPPEVDGSVFAGLLGHGGDAGEGGDRFGAVVGLADIAPLGENVGGV